MILLCRAAGEHSNQYFEKRKKSLGIEPDPLPKTHLKRVIFAKIVTAIFAQHQRRCREKTTYASYYENQSVLRSKSKKEYSTRQRPPKITLVQTWRYCLNKVRADRVVLEKVVLYTSNVLHRTPRRTRDACLISRCFHVFGFTIRARKTIPKWLVLRVIKPFAITIVQVIWFSEFRFQMVAAAWRRRARQTYYYIMYRTTGGRYFGFFVLFFFLSSIVTIPRPYKISPFDFSSSSFVRKYVPFVHTAAVSAVTARLHAVITVRLTKTADRWNRAHREQKTYLKFSCIR